MYPRVDFFIGLFLVVFSTAAHFVADKLPPAKLGLGAGDYPKVILKVLFVLGVILAGHSFYHIRKGSGAGDGDGDGGKYEKKELMQVLVLALCVAVYIRLVAFLGFIVLTPFFMFALMRIFGSRKWFKMVIISLVSTASIYLIFNNLLLVLLPRFTLF